MPLKLNVGLSKKVGDPNYGSRGASVNVEIELESALVSQPDQLKDRIRQIFNSLRSSLSEELNGNGAYPTAANTSSGARNGNGQHNGGQASSGKAQPARPATQSQIKAIHAIARSQQLDQARFLRDRFNRERPEDLTIKEASGAIDDLKRKE
jgi:hypothetical protein